MRNLVPVLALLAACGGDDANRLADAPHAGSDAGGDGGGSDGAANPVIVTVMGRGRPMPGVTLYVQDAATSTATTLSTDANGTADAVVAAGGYVTAVLTPAEIGGENTRLTSIGGVRPGDHVLVEASPPATTATAMTVTFSAQSGAYRYQVTTSCDAQTVSPSGNATESHVIYLDGCGSALDVLVVASFNNGTQAYLWAAGVTAADGGTANLAGQAFTPAPFVTGSVMNAPSAVFDFSRGFAFPHGGDVYSNNQTSGFPAPLPADAASFALVDASLSPSEHFDVYEWPASGDAFSYDYAGFMLPSYDSTPAWSQADGAVSWTVGAGTPPVAVETTVAVQSTSQSDTWYWSALAPWAGGSVTLPTLPTTDRDYNPHADDSVPVLDVTELDDGQGAYSAERATLPFDTRVAGAPGTLLERRVQPGPN